MNNTSPSQPQPQPQPPQPPRTIRKLIVEVVDAKDLLPKDGQGSASAYVVADFDGQRRRTSTKFRDLNPVWNEALDFVISDPENMEYEELEVDVYNDKKYCNANGTARKNHFLGRVKLYGTQFAKRGNEGLVYFPLEKRNLLSWIRGEIGLRIYYFDEGVEEAPPQNQPPSEDVPPERPKSPAMVVVEGGRVFEVNSAQMDHHHHGAPPPHHHHHHHGAVPEVIHSPPVVVIEESSPPPVVNLHGEPPPAPEMGGPPPPHEMQFPTEVRKMETRRAVAGERVRISRRPNGEYSPRVITGKFAGETTSERIHPYDLVEPMQYLFIRIVKARGLALSRSPYVKVRTSSHFVKSKPVVQRPGEATDSPEWHQVFALGHNRPDSASSTLEISVWDMQSEQFLGGVCFDLSDVPVRDPPDSPLAPQWYRLEGGDGDQNLGRVSGDIQLSVWIGTQADDAFPEAWSSDAPFVVHTRSKVYQSPKLWYLRVTIMEAQDLHIAPNLPPLTAPEIRVKAQLGFQSARTRRGSMNNHSASFHWSEDLIFVAGEPLEDSLILLVEDRTNKDAVLLGHLVVPVASIEQRFDERHVASKWFGLEGGGGGGGGFAGP
ncbi:C2 domain containing protein, partial [Parasponia andersonii]